MTTATLDELTALREGAAVCTPDLRFAVRVAGGDVLPWLDRISSNPVADIGRDTYVLATLLDGKGRMRTDMRVIAGGPPDEGLILDLPASHREALMRVIDMYIINDDVTVTDLSTELRFASVLGPRAADVLREAGIECPVEGRLTSPGPGAFVLPSRLAGVPGYDFLFDGNVGRELIGSVLQAGALRVERTALEVVRVSEGVPWFGPDLSDGVIPLEAHLHDHVSITKGCYPGQEVVARIQNLGQVSRKLVRLSCEGEQGVAAGDELAGTGDAEGKLVGTLTSVVFDPGASRTVALGFAKRLAWKDGERVRAGEAELTVHSLAGD